MIIDDDPAITKVLSTFIKRLLPDAEIMIAADCMTAVKMIDKLKVGRLIKKRVFPDIVLVDARLPVLDGFQCCEILSDMGVPNLIMLTAILTPDIVPQAVSAGADTIFKKSAGLKSIAQAIHAMAEAIEEEKRVLAESKTRRKTKKAMTN